MGLFDLFTRSKKRKKIKKALALTGLDANYDVSDFSDQAQVRRRYNTIKENDRLRVEAEKRKKKEDRKTKRRRRKQMKQQLDDEIMDLYQALRVSVAATATETAPVVTAPVVAATAPAPPMPPPPQVSPQMAAILEKFRMVLDGTSHETTNKQEVVRHISKLLEDIQTAKLVILDKKELDDLSKFEQTLLGLKKLFEEKLQATILKIAELKRKIVDLKATCAFQITEIDARLETAMEMEATDLAGAVEAYTDIMRIAKDCMDVSVRKDYARAYMKTLLLEYRSFNTPCAAANMKKIIEKLLHLESRVQDLQENVIFERLEEIEAEKQALVDWCYDYEVGGVVNKLMMNVGYYIPFLGRSPGVVATLGALNGRTKPSKKKLSLLTAEANVKMQHKAVDLLKEVKAPPAVVEEAKAKEDMGKEILERLKQGNAEALKPAIEAQNAESTWDMVVRYGTQAAGVGATALTTAMALKYKYDMAKNAFGGLLPSGAAPPDDRPFFEKYPTADERPFYGPVADDRPFYKRIFNGGKTMKKRLQEKTARF